MHILHIIYIINHLNVWWGVFDGSADSDVSKNVYEL